MLKITTATPSCRHEASTPQIRNHIHKLIKDDHSGARPTDVQVLGRGISFPNTDYPQVRGSASRQWQRQQGEATLPGRVSFVSAQTLFGLNTPLLTRDSARAIGSSLA